MNAKRRKYRRIILTTLLSGILVISLLSLLGTYYIGKLARENGISYRHLDFSARGHLAVSRLQWDLIGLSSGSMDSLYISWYWGPLLGKKIHIRKLYAANSSFNFKVEDNENTQSDWSVAADNASVLNLDFKLITGEDSLTINISQVDLIQLFAGDEYRLEQLRAREGEIWWYTASGNPDTINTEAPLAITADLLPAMKVGSLDLQDFDLNLTEDEQLLFVKDLQLGVQGLRNLSQPEIDEVSLSFSLGDSLEIFTELSEGAWPPGKPINLRELKAGTDGLNLILTGTEADPATGWKVHSTVEAELGYGKLRWLYADIFSVLNPAIEPDSLLSFSGQVSADESGMSLSALDVNLWQHTSTRVDGDVFWASEAGKLDLRFSEFSTTRDNLVTLLQEQVYNDFFLWPEDAHGDISLTGNFSHYLISGQLQTVQGELEASSVIDLVNDGDTYYQIKLSCPRLLAYQLLDYVPITINEAAMDLVIDGLYSDVADRDTFRMDIKVPQVIAENYTFEDLFFRYFFDKDQDSMWAYSHDPLARLDMKGAYYAGDTGRVVFEGGIDQLVPQKILSEIPFWWMKGSYTGAYTYTSQPDFFNLDLQVSTDSILTTERFLFDIDDLTLSTAYLEGRYRIELVAPGANELLADFVYPENIDLDKKPWLIPEQFSPLQASAELNIDSSTADLLLGVPFQAKKLSAMLSSQNDSGTKASVNWQQLEYSAYESSEVKSKATYDHESLALDLTLSELASASLTASGLHLSVTPEGDRHRAMLHLDDINALGPTEISLSHRQQGREHLLHLNNQDSVLILGERWLAGEHRGLEFNEAFKLVGGDLRLVSGYEKLSFSGSAESIEDGAAGHYVVDCDSLELTRFASVLFPQVGLDGQLFGSLNYGIESGDLHWRAHTSSLKLDSVEIGQIRIQGERLAEALTAHVELERLGESSAIDLRYENEQVDFIAELRKFDLSFLNDAMLPEDFRLDGKLSASLTGHFNEELHTDGWLYFEESQMKLPYLNNSFTLNQDSVLFRDKQLIFKDFRISDLHDQNLLITGEMELLPDISANLQLTGSNYTFLDQDKGDLLEGKASADVDLSIISNGKGATVSGGLSVIQGSYVTLYLPDDLSVTDPARNIQFVSLDDPELNETVHPSDFDLDMDIDFKLDQSDFEVILNPISREYVRFTAIGDLNLRKQGYDAPRLYGDLNSTTGRAMISLPIVPSVNMDIREVSLHWDGEPDQPIISFTGVESFRTSVSAIPELRARQDIVPVDLSIKLDQVRPSELEFQFGLYSSDHQLNSYLNSASTDDLESMAINLLLFGTLYYGESDGSNKALGAATSKLNELANRNLQNTDLVFSMQNKDVVNDDGSSTQQTSLNYQLRRNVYNNRLYISLGGDLGLYNADPNSSSLPSHYIGNIALDYQLFPASTFTLKAAREERYEGVIDGDITEYKLGFGFYRSFPTFRYMLGLREEQPAEAEEEESESKDTGP